MESISVAGALQEVGDVDSAPCPKCKLIFSTFFTLPHLSDCHICTRNATSRVVRWMDGIGGGWLIYIRV